MSDFPPGFRADNAEDYEDLLPRPRFRADGSEDYECLYSGLTGAQEEPVEQMQSRLLQWKDRKPKADLWFYAIGHSTLHLRLTDEVRHSNLHVICKESLTISGPLYWNEAAVQVAVDHRTIQAATRPYTSSLFTVFDATARFMLTCRRVWLVENVRPVY